MIARKDFTGIIGGKAKSFAAGDRISTADAAELGLEKKPDLAKKEKAPKNDKAE